MLLRQVRTAFTSYVNELENSGSVVRGVGDI